MPYKAVRSKHTPQNPAARVSVSAGRKRPTPRRHFQLIAGAAVLLALLLCHLTLFRQVAELGSLVCQQQPIASLQADEKVSLQLLETKRLSLLSELNERLALEQSKLQLANQDLEATNLVQSQHALTAPLTLFIGILSTNSVRRSLSREGWLSTARSSSGWDAKFIVHASSVTSISQEQEQHGDLLFTAQQSPLHQTLFLFQYALVHFDVQFIMKAEDTSYIQVPNLMQVLQATCTNAACHNQGLYLGSEMRNSSITVNADGSIAQAGQSYWEHTHLRTYMPHMLAAGYVLSSDLAHAVLDIEKRTGTEDWLFELGSDDITIGFWLMTLDIRRVNHSGILTESQGCCFQTSNPAHAEPMLTLTSVAQRAAAAAASLTLTTDLCQRDWLVISPIQQREELMHLEARLQECHRLRKLQKQAVEVAVRHATPCKLLLPHGKVRRLSPGSQQDQFLLGTYSGNPWSASGSTLLALKPKAHGNKLSIGLLKVSNTTEDDGWYWEHLDTSLAWNSRQGPELQWLGPTDRFIVFNDARCNGMQLARDSSCAVVFDILRLTRARLLPLPVQAASPDGRHGLHVSQSRLDAAMFGANDDAAPMQGTGHHGSPSSRDEDAAPDTDGVWLMDMFSGSHRLLLSLATLQKAVQQTTGTPASAKHTDEQDQNCFTWFSNPQFNRDATSIAALHHTANCSLASQPFRHIQTMLVTTNLQGQGTWLLPLPDVLHFDYGRGCLLVVSTRHGLFEADASEQTIQELKPPTSVTWSPISHVSYHQHSERFIAIVTAGPRQRQVSVWDRWEGHAHTVGLYSPCKDRTGFLHNELHPMWAPDGCTLAFDSTHTGQGWQVFAAGISGLNVDMVRSMANPTPGLLSLSDSPKQQPRHILVDVGSGTGGSIKRYLQANQARHPDIQIHAFEPDPAKMHDLQVSLTQHKLIPHTKLHEAAVWVKDGQVSMTLMPTAQNPAANKSTLYTQLRAALLQESAQSQATLPEPNSLQAESAPEMLRQSVDFSQWMFQNTRQADHVVVQMDMAGAECDVIEQLVADGSDLLIDSLDITWCEQLQPDKAEWMRTVQQILGKSGVQHAPKTSDQAAQAYKH